MQDDRLAAMIDSVCTFENISAYEILRQMRSMFGVSTMKEAMSALELAELAEIAERSQRRYCYCLLPTYDAWNDYCAVCHGKIIKEVRNNAQ